MAVEIASRAGSGRGIWRRPRRLRGHPAGERLRAHPGRDRVRGAGQPPGRRRRLARRVRRRARVRRIRMRPARGRSSAWLHRARTRHCPPHRGSLRWHADHRPLGLGRRGGDRGPGGGHQARRPDAAPAHPERPARQQFRAHVLLLAGRRVEHTFDNLLRLRHDSLCAARVARRGAPTWHRRLRANRAGLAARHGSRRLPAPRGAARHRACALAAMAIHHTRACVVGAREGYRTARTELGNALPPTCARRGARRLPGGRAQARGHRPGRGPGSRGAARRGVHPAAPGCPGHTGRAHTGRART